MSPNPRQIALDLLIAWQDSPHHIDALLADLDRDRQFSGRDRAFVHALVLGILRQASLLDFWIDDLRDRGGLKSSARWILRLGLFQLFSLGLPDHAAVNETVRLAHRERALVNAILRRAIREKDRLLAMAATAPAPIRHSLPPFLVDRWTARFGTDGFERFATAINQPAEILVRLNRLKPDARPPADAEELPDPPGFFRCRERPLEPLVRGHVYVQDPSTALAPTMLKPEPGTSVLDACAAPGGKAAHLAELMQNSGRLVAADHEPARLRRLRENLDRLGVRIATVEAVDWTRPAPGRLGTFDAILLDVPCSNTGVLRRRVDVRWRVTSESIRDAVSLQQSIVRHTVPLLNPGGRLVYSTCSLEPEENEDQVEWIAGQYPHLSVLASRTLLPQDTGFDGAFAALFTALEKRTPSLRDFERDDRTS